VRGAHEQVLRTCESEERRSGARSSAPRGRDAASLSERQDSR